MRALLTIGACAVALAAPAAARASGGPVPPVVGGVGASAPGGHVAYVAVSSRGGTRVERVHRATGKVARSILLEGRLGVPGATLAGDTTGLSADGRTLVLSAVWRAYPPRRTRLTVLDARRLRVRARLALRGSFAVDAISPDGRWLYLLHYRSPQNPLDYEVRAYDLRTRRLLRAPIVDPREPDEKMLGVPTTRTTSPDGRWVYTLYQRPEEAPFIHALDTTGRTAACIDLPRLSGDLSGVRLRLAGDTLRVSDAAGAQALVDTRTFAVRGPAAARRPPDRRADGDGGGTPWWPFAAGASVALALTLWLVARRRPLTAR